MSRAVMKIYRIVLHGTPGDESGSRRMYPVRPYEGEPRLTETVPMKRLDGIMVRDVDVVYFYTHTDELGIPHSRAGAARCPQGEAQDRGKR